MCIVLMSPAMAVPPNVLKKVIPLVIIASIIAFPQSNLCSTLVVFSAAQQTMNPLTVRVRRLQFRLPKQFRSLPLIVKVGFARTRPPEVLSQIINCSFCRGSLTYSKITKSA